MHREVNAGENALPTEARTHSFSEQISLFRAGVSQIAERLKQLDALALRSIDPIEHGEIRDFTSLLQSALTNWRVHVPGQDRLLNAIAEHCDRLLAIPLLKPPTAKPLKAPDVTNPFPVFDFPAQTPENHVQRIAACLGGLDPLLRQLGDSVPVAAASGDRPEARERSEREPTVRARGRKPIDPALKLAAIECYGKGGTYSGAAKILYRQKHTDRKDSANAYKVIEYFFKTHPEHLKSFLKKFPGRFEAFQKFIASD